MGVSECQVALVRAFPPAYSTDHALDHHMSLPPRKHSVTSATSPVVAATAHPFAAVAYPLVGLSKLINGDDNNLKEPLSCSGHSLPYSRASLIEIKPIRKGVKTSAREP